MGLSAHVCGNVRTCGHVKVRVDMREHLCEHESASVHMCACEHENACVRR